MAIYDRDYLTTLPLLYEKADEYSLGDWNKYNDDVGDALLKVLASSSHVVDYYFRKFLNALFLPNDDWDQKTLIWELTGYKPNYLRADYLMVQLYWPDCGLDSYVPLYQYTPFHVTADGKEYTFLCAQDYIIPPLTTRYNVRLVNGTLETIEQDYTQVLNNKIKLSDDDIDYDLVTVVISGTKWTQVRNVFYSPNTERIFSVHREEDGTYIYLHSTWQTYVDDYDTSFMIYYVKSFYDFELFTDDCLSVEFETELLTFDGDDVSQYYKIIPLLNSDEALSANNLMPSTTEGNRAITTLDFENNAKLFPGIAVARAYDWNMPEVCSTPFEVALIACDSKGRLTEHMKMVLKAYLESICSPLINVRMVEPRFAKQDILVVLDIGDYKGTLAEREIKRVVENTLADFYAIGNLPPGRVVKTKELNSLLLHADSRIFFATTSFLNPQINSPMIIPILGNVITITSAETFNAYDFGWFDEFAYIDPHRYDEAASSESTGEIGIFFRFNLFVNMIVPVDKYPMQLVDQGMVVEQLRPLDVSGGEFAAADFGVGSSFVHLVETGGDPAIGPVFVYVFETDGTCVFAKLERDIDTGVITTAVFQNTAYGTTSLTLPINSIMIEDDDIGQIKAALANAINTLPGLVDADNQPFNIEAGDIFFPGALGASDEAPEGAEEPVLDEMDDLSVSPLIMASGEPEGASEIDPSELYREVGVSEESDVTEREFVYIPYTNSIYKDFVQAKEESSVHKINFVANSYTHTDYNQHLGFRFMDLGRYTPVPEAYGTFTITMDTHLTIRDTYNEFVPVRPDIYSEKEVYGASYYIRSISGDALNWYFVSTQPTHEVEETVSIGYGIYVGFNLARDSALYVECDDTTGRGFIYSAEFTADDFIILDTELAN